MTERLTAKDFAAPSIRWLVDEAYPDSERRQAGTGQPDALQPWASNRMAYHRSRSLGVGAKIIRRRKSLTSICHCSKDRSISLTLIIYPPTPNYCTLWPSSSTNLSHFSAYFTSALV